MSTEEEYFELQISFDDGGYTPADIERIEKLGNNSQVIRVPGAISVYFDLRGDELTRLVEMVAPHFEKPNDMMLGMDDSHAHFVISNEPAYLENSMRDPQDMFYGCNINDIPFMSFADFERASNKKIAGLIEKAWDFEEKMAHGDDVMDAEVVELRPPDPHWALRNFRWPKDEYDFVSGDYWTLAQLPQQTIAELLELSHFCVDEEGDIEYDFGSLNVSIRHYEFSRGMATTIDLILLRTEDSTATAAQLHRAFAKLWYSRFDEPLYLENGDFFAEMFREAEGMSTKEIAAMRMDEVVAQIYPLDDEGKICGDSVVVYDVEL